MLNSENTKRMRQMAYALMEFTLQWGKEMRGKEYDRHYETQRGGRNPGWEIRGASGKMGCLGSVSKRDVVLKNISERRGG